MDYILLALRLLLLFISNAGFWSFAYRKTGIRSAFIPVFTAACQIFVLFFAGIFNILSIAAAVIFISGLVLFFLSLRREGRAALGIFALPEYIFCFAGVILCAFILNGAVLNNYDNFSHWGLVIKQMLMTDSFPSFHTPVIEYAAYPLGASSYIYYFARIVGNQEWIYMLAQASLQIFCLMPLFSLVKKHRALSCILIILLSNYLFVSGVVMNDLSVDTLLPLFGMCTLFFAYTHCLTPALKGEEKTDLYIYCLIPMLAGAWTIKNAGIFYVALAAVMLLIIFFKCRKYRRSAAVCFASPFIMYLLWKKHCDYVFVNAAGSMHAMTPENYLWQLKEKTAEDISNLASSLFEFSFVSPTFWALLAMLVIMGIVVFIFNRNLKKDYFKFLAIEAGVYILYMIGLLGMYIFSMPTYGGIAGAERYQMSVFTALVYLCGIFMLYLLSEIESRKAFAGVYAIVLAAFIVFWNVSCGGFAHIFTLTGDTTERMWLQNAKEEYDIPEESSYLIFTESPENSYLFYVGKYLFNSCEITSLHITSPEALEDIPQREYILVQDTENELVQQWLHENFPDWQGDELIINR